MWACSALHNLATTKCGPFSAVQNRVTTKCGPYSAGRRMVTTKRGPYSAVRTMVTTKCGPYSALQKMVTTTCGPYSALRKMVTTLSATHVCVVRKMRRVGGARDLRIPSNIVYIFTPRCSDVCKCPMVSGYHSPTFTGSIIACVPRFSLAEPLSPPTCTAHQSVWFITVHTPRSCCRATRALSSDRSHVCVCQFRPSCSHSL